MDNSSYYSGMKNKKPQHKKDGLSRQETKELGLTPDNRPKAAFNWFPGHMLKAMREIKDKIKAVDIVLEIRDARLPLVSGNKAMNEALQQKNRLILFNKANLADEKEIEKWEAWLDTQNINYMFLNCFDKPSIKKVVTKARSIVEERRKESNPDIVTPKSKLRMMILGLPNTGKSTIINQLVGKGITKVADKPGQTRVQQWITIDEELELLDTPGVLPPHVEREEHGYWLSLIHAIPDGIVGEEGPACYLIKLLLKSKSEMFKERYKLTTFDLSVDEALEQIAKARGAIKQKGLPDLERVFKIVIHDFRAGDLGKVGFDGPPKG